MSPTATRMPTRRQMQRDANTREIIKAAREQLTEVGPQDLSLRAVARAVGLAPSALYRYFDSRGSLIAALVDDSAASVAEAMNTAAAEAPPAEKSRHQLRALREWTTAHPSEFDLIFASRSGTGSPSTWQSLPVHTTLVGLVAANTPTSNAEERALAIGRACLGWIYTEHFGLSASQTSQSDFEAFLDFILS